MKHEMEKHRVVTFLTREEIDFLDKLGKDALFSSGLKLSRTRIIEDMVELLSKAQLSCMNIKTDEQLEMVMLRAMKELCEKYKQSKAGNT